MVKTEQTVRQPIPKVGAALVNQEPLQFVDDRTTMISSSFDWDSTLPGGQSSSSPAGARQS
jgi:hypothetical protein